MSTSAPEDRGETAPTAAVVGGGVPMNSPALTPTGTPGATIATSSDGSLDDEKKAFTLWLQNAEVIIGLKLNQLKALITAQTFLYAKNKFMVW